MLYQPGEGYSGLVCLQVNINHQPFLDFSPTIYQVNFEIGIQGEHLPPPRGYDT